MPGFECLTRSPVGLQWCGGSRRFSDISKALLESGVVEARLLLMLGRFLMATDTTQGLPPELIRSQAELSS